MEMEQRQTPLPKWILDSLNKQPPRPDLVKFLIAEFQKGPFFLFDDRWLIDTSTSPMAKVTLGRMEETRLLVFKRLINNAAPKDFVPLLYPDSNIETVSQIIGFFQTHKELFDLEEGSLTMTHGLVTQIEERDVFPVLLHPAMANSSFVRGVVWGCSEVLGLEQVQEINATFRAPPETTGLSEAQKQRLRSEKQERLNAQRVVNVQALQRFLESTFDSLHGTRNEHEQHTLQALEKVAALFYRTYARTIVPPLDHPVFRGYTLPPPLFRDKGADQKTEESQRLKKSSLLALLDETPETVAQQLCLFQMHAVKHVHLPDALTRTNSWLAFERRCGAIDRFVESFKRAPSDETVYKRVITFLYRLMERCYDMQDFNSALAIYSQLLSKGKTFQLSKDEERIQEKCQDIMFVNRSEFNPQNPPKPFIPTCVAINQTLGKTMETHSDRAFQRGFIDCFIVNDLAKRLTALYRLQLEEFPFQHNNEVMKILVECVS